MKILRNMLEFKKFFYFFAGRLRRLGGDQQGQTMTEYVILVIFVSLVCIPVAEWLPEAVQGYVRPFYYCLSRPIP